MPLLEHQARRIAEALDDCEDPSVGDIEGTNNSSYRLVVSDCLDRPRQRKPGARARVAF